MPRRHSPRNRRCPPAPTPRRNSAMDGSTVATPVATAAWRAGRSNCASAITAARSAWRRAGCQRQQPAACRLRPLQRRPSRQQSPRRFCQPLTQTWELSAGIGPYFAENKRDHDRARMHALISLPPNTRCAIVLTCSSPSAASRPSTKGTTATCFTLACCGPSADEHFPAPPRARSACHCCARQTAAKRRRGYFQIHRQTLRCI